MLSKNCDIPLVKDCLNHNPISLVNIINYKDKVSDDMIARCCVAMPEMIEHVSTNRRFNKNIVMNIINQSAYCLRDIPKQFLDRDIYLEACYINNVNNNNDRYDDVFSEIPEEYWDDKEFCLEAIKRFSKEYTGINNINYLLSHYILVNFFKDQDFCLKATSLNGHILKFVMDVYNNNKDYDDFWRGKTNNNEYAKKLYLAAVSQNGEMYGAVRGKFRSDRDICLAAFIEVIHFM